KDGLARAAARRPSRSSRRVTCSVAEPLNYQEMLRTIGTLLDMCRCERGILVVSPHGAEVSAPGWEYSRDWTMAGLEGVSALQKTWRGHPSAYRLPSMGHRLRLRVVGAELDAVGATAYTLPGQPGVIHVQRHGTYNRKSDTAVLERRIRLAQHLRGQLSPQQAASAALDSTEEEQP